MRLVLYKPLQTEEMLLIMFDLVEELVWMHDMQLLIAMMHFSQKNCLSEFTYVFHYRFFDRIAFNESSTPDLQCVQLEIFR